MFDMLRETRAFQDILKEGRQEGLDAFRQTLHDIIQARFADPKLTRLAKGQAAIIDDLNVLQSLILKASLAQTPEEAQRSLLDWPENGNE